MKFSKKEISKKLNLKRRVKEKSLKEQTEEISQNERCIFCLGYGKVSHAYFTGATRSPVIYRCIVCLGSGRNDKKNRRNNQ